MYFFKGEFNDSDESWMLIESYVGPLNKAGISSLRNKLSLNMYARMNKLWVMW